MLRIQLIYFFLYYRQQLIEEERIKLIKEHAKHLIGYFPRGILRENDKQYLNI